MKPLYILFLAACPWLLLAQKSIPVKEVPQVVLDGFKLAYPSQEAHSWLVKNKRFTANFKNEFGVVETAIFQDNGEWIETRYEADKSEIPERLTQHIQTRFEAYRAMSIQYVEENSGGSYFYVLLTLKSNKELSTELIFDLGGTLILIDGLPITQTIEPNTETAVSAASTSASDLIQPGIQTGSYDPNEGITDEILITLQKRYGIVEDIEWSKSEMGYDMATFKFRQEIISAEFDPDNGMQVSQILFVDKKSLPEMLTDQIAKKFSKARIESGIRVVYESRYSRMFRDKKLKNYYRIVISEKIKGEKLRKQTILYFDQSLQLEMIVESNE